MTKISPNSHEHYQNQKSLSDRAILARKVLRWTLSILKFWKSSPKSASLISPLIISVDSSDAVNYPFKFLNSLDAFGLTPHKLDLVVGPPKMLIINRDPLSFYNGFKVGV